MNESNINKGSGVEQSYWSKFCSSLGIVCFPGMATDFYGLGKKIIFFIGDWRCQQWKLGTRLWGQKDGGVWGNRLAKLPKKKGRWTDILKRYASVQSHSLWVLRRGKGVVVNAALNYFAILFRVCGRLSFGTSSCRRTLSNGALATTLNCDAPSYYVVSNQFFYSEA